MDKPNVEILRVLYFNRKRILLVTLVASVLALCTTYILKPKYRSLAYVYPANMVPYFMEQEYKAVSHTELLLQFCNSYDVRKKVMKECNLANHYELDTLDPKFQTYFNYICEENIKVSQTRYESVELNVLDTDPDTAQKVAFAIIDAVNKLILKEHLEKFNELINVNKAYLSAKAKAIDSLTQRLYFLSKNYGLVDLQSQIKEASRNYYRLMAEGKENVKINAVFKNIQEYGPELVTLTNCIQQQAKAYAEVETDVGRAVRDFNRNVTYMVVASKPTKPDIKYWPKRGIVVTITGIATLVLACLYFIYVTRLKILLQSIREAPPLTH